MMVEDLTATSLSMWYVLVVIFLFSFGVGVGVGVALFAGNMPSVSSAGGAGAAIIFRGWLGSRRHVLNALR